jgi:hypothetical protein
VNLVCGIRDRGAGLEKMAPWIGNLIVAIFLGQFQDWTLSADEPNIEAFGCNG